MRPILALSTFCLTAAPTFGQAPFLMVDLNGAGSTFTSVNFQPLAVVNGATTLGATYNGLPAAAAGPDGSVRVDILTGFGSFTGRNRSAPQEDEYVIQRTNPNDPSTSQNVGFLYKDFAFVSPIGEANNAAQGQNHIQLSFSSLQPNTDYVVAWYAWDNDGSRNTGTTGMHITTVRAPSFNDIPENTLIQWTSPFIPGDPSINTPPDPPYFHVTSDAEGQITLWGWGGDGVQGNPSADTSYLNGFTIRLDDNPAPPTPGDYNGDGFVDAADYTVWADHFGQTGSGVAGDGNNDGVVDAADYTVWADHFGQGTPPGGVAVPEPASLGFGLVGAAALLARRRR